MTSTCYDSVVDGASAYDRVVLTRTGVTKDASLAAANLGEGDWVDVRLTGADGLIGARAGQTAGFYVKLIGLDGSAGSISSFKLYFTSVSRAIASCACDPNFESTLVNQFPTSTAADFAPLEAGIVDEDTYVEQGLRWAHFHWAALEYILEEVQPDTDLLFLGNPVTDEFQHQFLALTVPADMDGNPNPYYDDVTNDNVPDGRLAIREGYIRAAYHEADETLGLGRELMGEDETTVFAASDHGFAPQWWAVNAPQDPHGRGDPDPGTAEQLPGCGDHGTWPRPAGPVAPRRSMSTRRYRRARRMPRSGPRSSTHSTP